MYRLDVLRGMGVLYAWNTCTAQKEIKVRKVSYMVANGELETQEGEPSTGLAQCNRINEGDKCRQQSEFNDITKTSIKTNKSAV